MKKVKVFLYALILVIGTFGSSISSYGSSYSTGKAVIPEYTYSSINATFFYVANITDKPIEITVTLYKHDGTILKDDGFSDSGIINSSYCINYDDSLSDATLSFTLDAHSTGNIVIPFNSSQPTQEYGYGVIQWTQDSEALQGLVAYGQHVVYYPSTGISTRALIPVNCGLPF